MTAYTSGNWQKQGWYHDDWGRWNGDGIRVMVEVSNCVYVYHRICR